MAAAVGKRLGAERGRRTGGLRTTAALAGVAAAGVLPLALAPTASAHDVVLSSVPENGGVVRELPDTVELNFSGIPQDLFNTVALSNVDSGEILYTGTPDLAENIISFNVPADLESTPGNYMVGFQITSSDGHSTKGSVSFTVGDGTTASAQGAAATTGAETEPAGAESTGGLESPWNWLLGGAAVLVIAGVVVMMIAKNRNNK